ncbi:hypothetical protein Btru_024413 [Bulinus truncatus]|nr:hypothetical protein Btru_024413 [Bulinus truncatus]
MSVFDQCIGDKYKEVSNLYESVFNYFDINGDNTLDWTEFHALIEELSNCSTDGALETFTDEDVSFIFKIVDLNQDNVISLEEFNYAWKYWLRQVLQPVKALVIVDVQNDFITGNLSLSNCPAGQDGAAVIPTINSLLDQNLFDVVVYTHDWHPEDHISFIDNISLRKLHSKSKVNTEDARIQDKVVFDVDGSPREQIMWPKHCVKGSIGAELHPDLKVVSGALHVRKGYRSDVDSYSAFWDNSRLSKTDLAALLGERSVTDVYVCGLAYDVCVGFTAKHALKHGFKTVFIEDASRGVSLDGINKMRNDLTRKGVYFADSQKIPQLTRGELRPFCFISKAALNYKVALELNSERAQTP